MRNGRCACTIPWMAPSPHQLFRPPPWRGWTLWLSRCTADPVVLSSRMRSWPSNSPERGCRLSRAPRLWRSSPLAVQRDHAASRRLSTLLTSRHPPIREQHSAAMIVCRGAFVESATEFPTRETAGVRSSFPGKTRGLRLAAANRKYLPCADACSALHAAGGRSCPCTEPFSAFNTGARDCHQTVGDHGRATRQS